MVFVYTTCADSGEAQKLGELMIREKIAACVDMWPIESMYMWDGKMADKKQTMMMITTHETKLQQVSDLISQNHSYSVPLIAGVDVMRVNPEYKAWVVSEIG